MRESEIRWNDEARVKILDDADRVLREAVVELAKTRSGDSSDDLFAEINSRMNGRFIDYEPGPDVRKYADAIAGGDIETGESTSAPRDQVLGQHGTDVDHQAVGSESAGDSGAGAPDGGDTGDVVNDG